MASPRSAVSLLLLLGLSLPVFAAEGMFQGRVVAPPENHPVATGWVYVQGRNHMLRRVEVSGASIVFGKDVPERQRHKCGMECLTPGLEIQITAEQDSSGEWRAKRIEILRLAARQNLRNFENQPLFENRALFMPSQKALYRTLPDAPQQTR